jgi:hypothetical protein
MSTQTKHSIEVMDTNIIFSTPPLNECCTNLTIDLDWLNYDIYFQLWTLRTCMHK